MGPQPAGLGEIEKLFTSIISVIVGLSFIALLMLLIWAGFKYLMSGGEQKNVQQAHQTITWAFLGIIFLALAWLILNLIQIFTGVEVTVFNVKALCNVAGNATDWCKPSPPPTLP